MNFLNFFKTQAKPIEINVTNHAQLIRNVNRLTTLYLAKRQGDTRPELDTEIELRRNVCKDYGHDIPYTLEEASILQTKVNR